MPDVGGVGGRVPGQEQSAGIGKPIESAKESANQAGQQTSSQTAVGQPGTLGQPTGMPVPGTSDQSKLMPDVLAGRDASQMIAAERMRDAGGVSATEKLLGLNLQPSVMGAFATPPGNSEALRHMTPAMRRMIMRGLLEKQRERMSLLTRRLRDDQRGGGQNQGEQETDELADALPEDGSATDERQLARARAELGSAARMFFLLNELLVMQDYAISQMGTHAQG